ncbi:MAG: ATP-binding protein, partial [Pseudonocardiaceae bacterium]
MCETAFDRVDALSGGARLTALAEAVDAYPGYLPPGTYDDGSLGERERLKGRYVQALDELSTLLQERGDHAAAAGYAERLLLEEPLREATYRLLMHAHDARGDRARAMQSYHVCVSTLERELEVGPAAQTRAAYESLLPAVWTQQGPRPVRVGCLPLVGRAAERGRLAEAWRATQSGQTQLVLLIGPPGIGKTRLAEEFAAWCVRRGAMTATARANAADGSLAYAPVVSWLRSPPVRATLSRHYTGHLAELVRLLPELLTEVPGLGVPEPLPGDEQRSRLFDAVARALFASGRPVLLLADDIHRFDRESLRLVHHLLHTVGHSRLMVVGTARPDELERGHPIPASLEGYPELELGPLSRAEAATVIEVVTGESPSNSGDRLYRDSEGNPLFLVESLLCGSPDVGGSSPR